MGVDAERGGESTSYREDVDVMILENCPITIYCYT